MSATLIDELVAIARHFAALERDAICCGDVTVAQCVALQHLARVGARDASTLADDLRVTPGAATRQVDGMVRRGWLERTRDPEDRRRVLIELTDAGRTEAERLRQLTEQSLGALLEHIPSDEHDTVQRALSLVRRALEASPDALAACCVPAGDRR